MGKQSQRSRVFCMVFMVLLGAFLLIVHLSKGFRLPGTPHKQDLQHDQQLPHKTQHVETEPSLASTIAEGLGLHELDDASSPSTFEDLMRKGFPIMPPARRAAYFQTKDQSIPEVVADLGNIITIGYCVIDQNVVTVGGSDILRWRTAIPQHIKVIRLIEEGRRDPDAVSSLLYEAIRNCISDYDEVRQARDIEFVKIVRRELPHGVIGDNDEYYAEHRKYERPGAEFERLNNVIYSAFYILANINKQEPKLLTEWIEKKQHPQYHCTDMMVWLIDCHFRENASEASVHASRHAELTQGNNISGSRVPRSVWNAGWDIHNPLLKARQVNTSDIQTIEVLAIPQAIPIEDELKAEIIQNFLAQRNEIMP